MYVCMGLFMVLITTLVLRDRSQDSLPSVLVRSVLAVISALLDLRAGESLVRRHVKPPCRVEASGKPRALSWGQTQATGALAHVVTN